MIVVLCLEKIETLERLVTELKPKEDEHKSIEPNKSDD